MARTAPRRGEGRPGLRRARLNHSTARMNQSAESIESYSGSPTSPEKWPGISPSLRCDANVLRTCASGPMRPWARARPGRGDHRLPAPVREPRETREDRGSVAVRRHEGLGAARHLVEDRIRRRRKLAPPTPLGVEEVVGVAGDLFEREEGEDLGVGPQRPLPLDRAPEVLFTVVAARRFLRVPEVAIPGGIDACPAEHPAHEQARQIRERLDPGGLAANLGRRIPVAGLLLEAVRAAEGQQRPDTQVDLGGSPVRPADHRHGAVADDAQRALDRKLGGFVEPGGKRLEAEPRGGRRAVAGGRVAVDLSREARRSGPGPSRTRRSPRPSSSAGGAGGSPGRTSRGSGASARPAPCRTRIRRGRRPRATRGRVRGPADPRRTIRGACGRCGRRRRTRRSSRQVAGGLSGRLCITPRGRRRVEATRASPALHASA